MTSDNTRQSSESPGLVGLISSSHPRQLLRYVGPLRCSNTWDAGPVHPWTYALAPNRKAESLHPCRQSQRRYQVSHYNPKSLKLG